MKKDIQLAKYTSWRIGGLAKKYYRPESVEELSKIMQEIPMDTKIFWLGLGSNVLISDKGFDGVVIHTLKGLDEISLSYADSDKINVRALAGTTCSKFAKFVAANSGIGLEFFSGIPGTVGGALAMNAGAWGGETWDFVTNVTVINRDGKLITRNPNEYTISYRKVTSKLADEEWFVSAEFCIPLGDSISANNKMRELIAIRNAKQPIGVLSCGSVFKNPSPKYAAELIESSKLKGVTIGGASVSKKHANFIINDGSASSDDVLQLIKLVQDKVNTEHNIKLQPEVVFVGQAQE